MAVSRNVFNPKNPNLLVGLSATILAATIGIKLFIDYYVFPVVGNYLTINIPSKSGRDTLFFVDPSEFNIPSIVAIVVAAVFTAVIFYLAKRKKLGALMLTLIANLTLALMYFAVLLGNAFHELWGGAWSILGVGIALVLVFGLELIFFFSVKPEQTGTPEVK